MAQRTVSAISLYWSHPGYTPNGGAAGDLFRMDSSRDGIDELTVGGYQLSDAISERTGVSVMERQRRSNKLNDLADVPVSFVNDFATVDGPARFFKSVYDDADKRPCKLEWRYANDEKDEADFLVEMNGRPIEVGSVVMGNITLKYYGSGRNETRP